MKPLQNYKIETLGLNEAILHKAVEEGYNDFIGDHHFLDCKYIYLQSSGALFLGEDEDYFNKDSNHLISAHDFLRLNWTPKVGEEVECVDDSDVDTFVDNGGRHIIRHVEEYGIFIEGFSHWFNINRFIPVLPRKKQLRESSLRFKTEQEFESEFGEEWRSKVDWSITNVMDGLFGSKHPNAEVIKNRWSITASMLTDKPLPEEEQDAWTIAGTYDNMKLEKPDAYIIDSAKLGDGTWVLYLIVREGGENIKSRIFVYNAYKYRLLSESDYKAKYPDKLMFKGWDIKSVDKEKVKHFLYLCELADKYGVEPNEISYFLNVNKTKLGL